MNVLFEHRSRINNRMVIGLKGGDSVVFINGVFQTTDKEIVKELISHPFYKREKFKLKTDSKLVSDWLENDNEPSYIDQAFVSKMNNEAIMELGEELDLRNKGNLGLLRSELIGEPVGDVVNEVMAKYEKKPEKKTTRSRSTAQTKVTKLEDKE